MGDPLLLLSPLLALVLPAIVLFTVERRHRAAWQRVRFDTLQVGVGTGAFRQGEVAEEVSTVTQDRAPAGIRLAAFTCFVSGQMLIPAVPVWLLGVVIALGEHSPPHGNGVLTLMLAAGPPGAWAALEVLRCGHALLGGQREIAAHRIRRAVSVTVVLNVLLAAAACVMIAARAPEAETLAPCLVYMIVSLLQAAFVWVMFHRHAPAFAGDP